MFCSLCNIEVSLNSRNDDTITKSVKIEFISRKRDCLTFHIKVIIIFLKNKTSKYKLFQRIAIWLSLFNNLFLQWIGFLIKVNFQFGCTQVCLEKFCKCKQINYNLLFGTIVLGFVVFFFFSRKSYQKNISNFSWRNMWSFQNCFSKQKCYSIISNYLLLKFSYQKCTLTWM